MCFDREPQIDLSLLLKLLANRMDLWIYESMKVARLEIHANSATLTEKSSTNFW